MSLNPRDLSRSGLSHRSLALTLSIALVSSFSLPLLTIAAGANAAPLIAQAQTAQKRRIAVLDFDSGSISGNPLASGWLGQGAAKGVSDLIVNKLVDSGIYRVMERSKLDAILQEQNLGESGRVDAGTAAKIGKLLGVEAILIGSITQFNVDEKSSGFSFGGLFGNSGKKSLANVQITARLVDTETGEIIATSQGKGEADQKSGSTTVFGIGGGDSVSNNDSLLIAAADKAVTQLVTTVIDSASKLNANAGSSGLEALIADIGGGQITLNKGSIAGFAKGMQISVERVTKQVKDPATGKVLRQVSSSIGRIELTEVARDYAVGRIISGSGFKVGDTVKSMK
jgi:curli biogenesis system outer membrane secretion channel CsgG